MVESVVITQQFLIVLTTFVLRQFYLLEMLNTNQLALLL